MSVYLNVRMYYKKYLAANMPMTVLEIKAGRIDL
jgi:hypothetical protein